VTISFETLQAFSGESAHLVPQAPAFIVCMKQRLLWRHFAKIQITGE
jgi:hypothetical protein